MRKRAVQSTSLKVISAPPAKAIAPQIREVIEALGEDPAREGLVRTPERVEKALRFLTSGYSADIGKIVNGAIYEVKYDEMVIVKDIEFFSMCEHHMLPFYGKVHVAYIARNKVIGLSKLPRIIDAYARRLQIQERLTNQIANAIQAKIAPLGVGVVVEGRHLCMVMRGVEKESSQTVTSAMLGSFKDNPKTREEFLSLIRGK